MRIAKFLLLLCLTGTLAAQNAEFALANRNYEQGQFAAAKDIYGRLVGAGIRSSHLFYNLGNTEFRLGNKGAAALNYERALALEPLHAEAQANLELLRSQTGAQVPKQTWADALFGLISVDNLSIAGALGFWAALMALSVGVLKGWNRSMLLLLVSGLAVLLYAGAGVWLSTRKLEGAIVLADADARFAPADRAGLVARLPIASRLRLLADRGPWVYCLLPDGKRGWLQTVNVERIALSTLQN